MNIVIKAVIMIALFPYSLILIPFIFKRQGCYIAILLAILPILVSIWGIYSLVGEQQGKTEAIAECLNEVHDGRYSNPDECSTQYRQYALSGLIAIVGELLPTPYVVEWLNER